MKYQFKEGDGSHRDMTIEQCNLVLRRLIKQGYEYFWICNNEWPRFVLVRWHSSLKFDRCGSNCLGITNEIPFERWMEILDMNESKEKAVSIATEAIKEHQRQCKAALEINKAFSNKLMKPFDENFDWYLQREELITEMKEVLDNPEKLRKLAEKLTNL